MHSLYRHWFSGAILFFASVVFTRFAQGQVSSSAGGKGSVVETVGSLSDSVPIEVPPGRNGLTPQLSLVYNASAENGFLGVGWDLPIGYIIRNTRDGVSYTCDPSTSSNPCYVFKMGKDSSELIPRADLCSGCYGATIGGTLMQFRSLNDGWEGTDKIGNTYFFGQTPASRQDGPLGTFRWMLERVADKDQNTITYSYYKNQSESLGEIYINRIDYQSTSILFLRGRRSDVQTMYAADFAVSTAYRLWAIDILTEGARIRRYEMGYCDMIPSCPSSSTGVSLLGSVTQYGGNGVRTRQTITSGLKSQYFN